MLLLNVAGPEGQHERVQMGYHIVVEVLHGTVVQPTVDKARKVVGLHGSQNCSVVFGMLYFVISSTISNAWSPTGPVPIRDAV